MTRLFRAHGRAERFDSLVEGERRDDLDAETLELLEVVGALRSVEQPQPRPEFVADLRAQLMAAAETELAPAAARQRDDVARLTLKPVRPARQRRLSVAVGALAIVGATTSVGFASQGAIPGDPLYPVKRAIENTEAGFSVGDDAKGQAILGNAAGRLDEVEQLTRGDDPDAELVTATLEAFSDQAGQAGRLLIRDYQEHGDPEPVSDLLRFTQDSLDQLSALERSVPAASHDALVDAAGTVFALGADAINVCPTECGDPLTDLPPQLLASATQGGEETAGPLAGGELPGTQPTPSTDAQDQPGQSGLTPPQDPVVIPPLPTDTSDAGDLLDDVVPGTGTDDGGQDGGDGNDGGGGKDGKGGKGGKGKPVDLAPVTDTVNQVVTGVVQGLDALLGGLVGGGQAGQ